MVMVYIILMSQIDYDVTVSIKSYHYKIKICDFDVTVAIVKHSDVKIKDYYVTIYFIMRHLNVTI